MRNNCDLRSKIEVSKAEVTVRHIPHNSFLRQKSQWKVQVNVVTLQELKMVCRESNEITGEKIILYLTAKKKLFAFGKV